MSGVVSTNDGDGCIRTRQVPANEKHGLSLHARRPQQRTPPIDRAAKRTWFNEARVPQPPRSISKPIFLLYRTQPVFRVFTLPTKVAFGTCRFVDHTIIHTYTCTNSFWRPNFCKRKTDKIRSNICVRKSHTHLFSD